MALVPLKKKKKNPTPTLAQLLNWAGSPVKAKHIQSLGPSSLCHPEKKTKQNKTQAVQ